MTDTATSVRYVGGPLDGQGAESARPIYRNADGSPARAMFGDRRLMHGAWQPDETGIYTRNERGYRWIAAPAAGTVA